MNASVLIAAWRGKEASDTGHWSGGSVSLRVVWEFRNFVGGIHLVVAAAGLPLSDWWRGLRRVTGGSWAPALRGVYIRTLERRRVWHPNRRESRGSRHPAGGISWGIHLVMAAAGLPLSGGRRRSSGAPAGAGLPHSGSLNPHPGKAKGAAPKPKTKRVGAALGLR